MKLISLGGTERSARDYNMVSREEDMFFFFSSWFKMRVGEGERRDVAVLDNYNT